MFPKANTISLGKYPKVSLARAREERDKCLDLLARGIDPSLHRRLAKDAKIRTDTVWIPYGNSSS
jgi:hypothetical protein